MSDFRKLAVWQKADAFSARIDTLSIRIEKVDWKLAKQLRDAAASIPSTIAEGRGRATDRDFAHFLTMAIASCNEVENHLIRALRLACISSAEHDTLMDALVEIRKMLHGLRNRLRRSK